jgi:sugar phosphate isomerase/epimerase
MFCRSFPWIVLLLFTLNLGLRAEGPEFFAMDTAVRGLDNLKSVKELGYSGIGWKWQDAAQMRASAEKVRESGLKLFAVYGGLTLLPDGIQSFPSADWEARFAALSGTGAVVWLPVYSRAFPVSSEAGDVVAVPKLRELADLAAKHGLRVALYPHMGAWVERVQDAVRIARQVNRPNFGATFNLCHCLMAGDEARIPELLREAAPVLMLVTVNGADRNAARTNWQRLIRPMDEGDFPVRDLMQQLKAIGYAGPVGLQGFGVSVPPLENLRRSMTAWRSLFLP